MRKNIGISIIELLMVVMLISVLTLPMLDVLNSTFFAEYKNRTNVESKESREIALTRMTSTLKSASYLANESTDGSITIPIGATTTTITPGDNSIVALVPKYDANDNYELIQQGGQTLFEGYAYSLVPRSLLHPSNSSEDEMSLVETYTSFYCTPYDGKPIQVPSLCETNWAADGKSNVIIDKIKPGIFSNYTSAFGLSDVNLLEIAFGIKSGQLYYPSSSGESIENGDVHSLNILCRNVPLI